MRTREVLASMLEDDAVSLSQYSVPDSLKSLQIPSSMVLNLYHFFSYYCSDICSHKGFQNSWTPPTHAL